MNKKIINKLKERQRVSEKLKTELYEFQQSVNKLEGIETVKMLSELAKESEDGDQRSDIYLAIKNGVFGAYFAGSLFNMPDPSMYDIDDVLKEVGIKNTLDCLKRTMKRLEQLGDFSKYDKSLKELIFEKVE